MSVRAIKLMRPVLFPLMMFAASPSRAGQGAPAALSDMGGGSADTAAQSEFSGDVWQSRFVPLLCIAAAFAIAAMLLRQHTIRLTRRIKKQFEDRILERDRAARELHDTLLQNVQGLVLRFQSVANRLPDGEPAREQLEAVLKRADGVLLDGHSQLRALGLGDLPARLPEMLAEHARHAGLGSSVSVKTVIEGDERPIFPEVAEELCRITAAVLTDIADHATATRVYIVLAFETGRLELRLSDNGTGMRADLLASDRFGAQYGAIDMRERVARIGGDVSVAAAGGKGAMVKVSIPARFAFANHRPGFWRLLLANIGWRKADG